MRTKKITSYILSVLIVLICGWLVWQITRPEVLSIGDKMPAIEFEDKNKKNILVPDSSRKTILMFFNRNCEHCIYQLKGFEQNIEKFSDTQIYLFTIEKKFWQTDFFDNWSHLLNRDNVICGVVKQEVIDKQFGSTVTPYIYVFNSSGELIQKFKGEVIIEKIIDILKKSDPRG